MNLTYEMRKMLTLSNQSFRENTFETSLGGALIKDVLLVRKGHILHYTWLKTTDMPSFEESGGTFQMFLVFLFSFARRRLTAGSFAWSFFLEGSLDSTKIWHHHELSRTFSKQSALCAARFHHASAKDI